MVEFRLLSALEVRVGGRPVPLGHARQQCVLAALLIDANRPVSADQLLHRVWDSAVPRRARDTLYAYVSRLRHTLEPHGIRLARRSGGYVIDLDETTVDLHRFRHLIARARKAPDDQSALSLFEEALGLWRGEPLAGLDSPWLDAVREQLRAERWTAELDRTDTMLHSGRHSECLAGLSVQAATHPLDERLAGQFMLALYRNGRSADALAHYQRLRERLAEELGIDPGSALQRLHQQILTTDPALEIDASRPAPAAPAPPQVPVPRQLSASPKLFTGRERELAELDHLLRAGSDHGGTMAISSISGVGGIGKTCLALRWAHRRLECFPDGQLYLDLRGFAPSMAPLSPAAALRDLLDALGADPATAPTSLDGQVGLYRSLISGRRMLVMLDNARDTAQVLPLLPGSPTCTVLVTSRHCLTGLTTAHGARLLTLGPLPTTEARQLLSNSLGPHRVEAEPDSAAELLDQCAGLPLAISVLAARAATHPDFPLKTLTDEMHSTRDTLDAFDGGDEAADVRAVFSWSYHALSTPAGRLFRLLGTHPGPDITPPAAASLAGILPRDARPLLAELTRAHLTTEHLPGRYTLHDLLRTYAAELAATDSEAQQALHRTVDHYLHSAYSADRLLWPHRDPITLTPALPGTAPETPADLQQALTWFTGEHTVLTALAVQARRAGLHTHTWQLAWTLSTFLSRQSHWHDLAAAQHAALAAATHLTNRSEQARAHRELGNAYCETDQYDKAYNHLQQALDLSITLGDRLGEAHTHLNLGWVYERHGDQRQALHHDLRALDLFQAAGHQAGQARALNAAGWDHAQLGEYRQTLTYCQEALTLQRELGDRRGEANTWDSLGYAHQHLGAHRQAATCYHNSLVLNRELGHRFNQAENLDHLGDTHHATGDTTAAREAWQQAADILTALGHNDTQLRRLRDKLSAFDASRTLD